jgi:hypothetical protein
VRKGDWKLLGNPKDTSNAATLTDSDQLFLCQLGDDPGETRNVASNHPEIVKRLQALRETYETDIQAR